jgi:DNA-binding CsgD family transcriptional regulator
MEVYDLREALDSSRPGWRELPGLVDSLGTPAFENRLYSLVRKATGSIHLTAFAHPTDGETRLLIAADQIDGDLAKRVGRMYVTQHWSSDPINRILNPTSPAPRAIIVRAHGDEVRRAEFRRRCYDRPGWKAVGATIADRVSLMTIRDEQLLKISFHRSETDGLFGDDEVDWMAENAALLFALIQRNDRLTHGTAVALSRSFYAGRLADAAPQLTQREADVCLRIAQGLTSEGIAIDLGISLNTVRTYRKRAYRRLNISSQNELMTLLLWTPRTSGTGH